MGLYKENKFKDIFNNKKLWYVIGGIVILVILIYLISLVNFGQIFEKENIKIKFIENPLILSKKDNTLMEITIINNTEKDLENLELRIKNIEETLIIFCPDSKTKDNARVIIPKVASGNERLITCNVRKDPTIDFFEGTYSFEVDYYIEDVIVTKRADLNVKR